MTTTYIHYKGLTGQSDAILQSGNDLHFGESNPGETKGVCMSESVSQLRVMLEIEVDRTEE